MKVSHVALFKCVMLFFIVSVSVYSADRKIHHSKNSESSHTYTIHNDIAFVSVWGSRPAAKRLKGFQYAVLYNARGEIVQRVEMGRDSIYHLDRMIQKNRTRGPLVIRMFRK